MFIAGQPLSPSVSLTPPPAVSPAQPCGLDVPHCPLPLPQGSRVSLLEVEDQQQGSGEDEDGQLLLDDQDFSDYHVRVYVRTYVYI